MHKPVLSVSLTNYNYGSLLPRALDSVLAQTYTDFELIVVDNASTDDSLDILRRYSARDSRIRLIVHAENQGLARSLAEAGAAAEGQYHVHIDADDWVIDPTAFERQIAVLQRDPSISVVYSPIVMFDASGAMKVYQAFPHDQVFTGEAGIAQAVMGKIINTGPMMRMSAFRKFGGYNTSYLYAIDVKLAVDLCGVGRVAYINRPLYAFYQHPCSLTNTSSVAAKQRELVRAVESAFSGPLRGKIPNARWLRHRALGHMLTLHATQFVFAGNYRCGWAAFASGSAMRPLAALGQRRALNLVVRTVLGARGYRYVRARFRRTGAQPTVYAGDSPDVAYAMASMK